MEIFYAHDDVEKLLDTTGIATRAKITRLFFLIAERGHMLGMPHVRRIAAGLYEARILGERNIRIFYTFRGGDIVLLHALSKKTQKLRSRDIDIARKRMKWLHEL